MKNMWVSYGFAIFLKLLRVGNGKLIHCYFGSLIGGGFNQFNQARFKVIAAIYQQLSLFNRFAIFWLRLVKMGVSTGFEQALEVNSVASNLLG